uniref:Uncharacterized protein n=1 Tax=Anguilla anguilla TaxID=7936 RepID=A0A0E9SEH1_ANGAN
MARLEKALIPDSDTNRSTMVNRRRQFYEHCPREKGDVKGFKNSQS